MTSNEMVTVEYAANLIQPKLDAQKAAWRAWMDAPAGEEPHKAYRQAVADLIVAVEIYLPTILSAIERAKEAA